MLNRLAILPFALVAISSSVLAQSATPTLPAPTNLRTCTAQDSITSFVEQASSKFGEHLGCFLSEDKVVLRGSRLRTALPLEYAYAVGLRSGPYSATDIEDLFLAVNDQWKNYKPLDQQAQVEYDRKINDLVAKSLPSAATGVAISVEPPVLVSIRRIGTEAYAVVSLRQRRFTLADDVIVSTAVDATALTLKGDSMLRLSLVRELQTPSDISNVQGAIAEWIRAVRVNGNR